MWGVVWLLAASATAAAGPFDTLNALLADVVLNVKPMVIVDEFGVVVELNNTGNLSGVSFEDVQINPSRLDNETVKIDVSVTGMHVVLSGDFEISVHLVSSGTGNADLVVALGALNAALVLKSNAPNAPSSSLAVTSCKLESPKLKFENCAPTVNSACSAMNDLLAVAEALSQISKLLCTQVKDLLPALADPLLGNASQALLEFNHPIPPPAPFEKQYAATLEECVNLNATAGRAATSALQQYIGEVVDDPAARPRKTPAINTMLNMSIIKTEYNFSPPLVIASQDALNATVSAVRMKGAPNGWPWLFNKVDLPAIRSNHTVGAAVDISTVALEVDLNLALQANKSLGNIPRFNFSATVSIEVADISVDLQATVGLNATELGGFEVAQLLDKATAAACLAAPVKVLGVSLVELAMAPKLSLNVTEWYDTIREVQVPIASSDAINTLLATGINVAVLEYYDALFTGKNAAVPYAASEALNLVNLLLQSMVVAPDNCPAPPTPATKVPAESSDSSAPSPWPYQDPVDFGTMLGGLLTNISKFLGKFSPSSFPFGVERMLRPAVAALLPKYWNGTALDFSSLGELCLDSDPLEFKGFPMTFNLGHTKLCVSNFTLTGLKDLFSTLVPLKPEQYGDDPGKYVLRNTMELAGTDTLGVNLDVRMDWERPLDEGDDSSDHFHVGLNLHDVNVVAAVRLLLGADKLAALKVGELFSPACTLSTFLSPHGFNVTDALLKVATVEAAMYCHDCSSPLMEGLFQHLNNNSARLTNVTNNLMAYTLARLRAPQAEKVINTFIGNASCGAPLPKPPHFTFDVEDDGEMWEILIMLVLGGGPLLMLFLVTVVQLARISAKEKDPERKPLYATDQDRPPSPVSAADDAEDDTHSRCTAPTWCDQIRFDETLWGHPTCLSPLMKWTLLLLLVITMIMVLLSMIWLDFLSVMSYMVIGGSEHASSLYDQGTWSFGHDGWNSGKPTLKLMAFGVLLSSGSWAVVKVLLCIWLMFVPPTVISHKMRTALLILQDYLGKWSLLSIFLNILLIPFVDVTFEPSTEKVKLFTEGVFSLSLHIELRAGFYVFGVSQIINQIVGQVLLFNNRNLVASVKKQARDHQKVVHLRSRSRQTLTPGKATPARSAGASPPMSPTSIASAKSYATTTWFAEGGNDTRKEALREHLYGGWMKRVPCCASRDKKNNRVRLNLFARSLVFFTICGAIALFIIGYSQEFIRTEYHGAIALLIDACPDSASIMERSYNFQDMVHYIFIRTRGTEKQVLITCMLILLIVVVLVSPIMLMLTLLAMWFLPLTLRRQKQLYFLSECLASWSAPELMVMALAMLTPALQDLVLFIAGDRLDAVQDVVIWGDGLGLLDIDSPTLLGGNGDFVPGFWFLFGAALAYNLVYVVLHFANRAAIRYRERQAYNAWVLERKLGEGDYSPRSDPGLPISEEHLPSAHVAPPTQGFPAMPAARASEEEPSSYQYHSPDEEEEY
eukprot:TRINITY_DN2849_c0_g2_i1.p1 TRINITY_DN2849_c0_g2~~TRINITY_DN2849_c0_g2_i1.p1  ORF type:complete len:1477 (+),score=403.64 TRINITY_DN2849_c0_g2_i1:93-4523(+)